MVSFIINAFKIGFLLGFLVFIHEGAHFIVAKICKVKVNEFAIGFGPMVLKKQGKDTKYVLRLIPLGGFVNLEGEEERSDSEGSFSKASIGKRIAIVAAGGVVNILFGLISFFILSLVYTNLKSAFINTYEFAFSMIESLKMLFSGAATINNLTGPIGISEVVAKTVRIDEFIYNLSLISLSLGVTNLLPFPPLDGGKIVLLIIEGIRKKPLEEKIEVNIQLIGFSILILLSIYVAYNDILKIF